LKTPIKPKETKKTLKPNKTQKPGTGKYGAIKPAIHLMSFVYLTDFIRHLTVELKIRPDILYPILKLAGYPAKSVPVSVVHIPIYNAAVLRI
jgi:hypothetical protein